MVLGNASGDRNGIDAQVAQCVERIDWSVPDRSSACLAFDSEVTPVALKDTVDKCTAAQCNAIGEVSYPTTKQYVNGQLPAVVEHLADLIRREPGRDGSPFSSHSSGDPLHKESLAVNALESVPRTFVAHIEE